MPWSGLSNAGFTTGTPWRKINPDFTNYNVDSATKDAGSVWHFWKKMVELRKSWKNLVYGDFEMILPHDERLFTYQRTSHDDKNAWSC